MGGSSNPHFLCFVMFFKTHHITLAEVKNTIVFRKYVLTHAAFNSAAHPVAEILLGQNEFDSNGACSACKPGMALASFSEHEFFIIFWDSPISWLIINCKLSM
jgi:hypothetical protein